MAALTCDICGGNLAMNESGEFAVCESCGMKHTKERVKVKVQEVKGVVEITKGEAEKERLLNNAEKFIQLEEWYKARETYKQLIDEYPSDYRGWFGEAKLVTLSLPKFYSLTDAKDLMCWDFSKSHSWEEPYNELGKEYTLIRDKYQHILNNIKKCSMISGDSESVYFEQLLNISLQQHCDYIKELSNKLKHRIPFFEEIKSCLYDDAFVPQKIEELILPLSKNASYVENHLGEKNSHKYENLLKIGKVYPRYKKDWTKIYHIRYLTETEAFCTCFIAGDEYTPNSLGGFITFDKTYSLEELINVLLSPTNDEQLLLWKKAGLCEKCGSDVDENSFCKKCNHLNEDKRSVVRENVLSLCRNFPDQVNLLEEIYSRYDHRGKKRDGGYDTLNSPRKRIYTSGMRINNVRIDKIDILSDRGPNVYVYYTAYGDHGLKSNYSLVVSCDDIPNIINYLKGRTIKNKCQACGGSFKGLITKVCTNCGRTKDF